eukprot:TRINITY_DN18628_c0_g1_i1.p1 TRINITY_DN18628_c0_g1~~TRINITY_DN18628_c0_g1_i1.p1  ORF type:complete len:145 (+),score=29.18 TRINITY_DN18628_c0_g1_i1:84-518(+)
MWYTPTQLRAAFFMRPIPPVLTQKQQVTRQYKKVILCLRDHAGHHRQQWITDIGEARYQYELNRHETDPLQIDFFLKKGEDWLKYYAHWAPYKFPDSEDGSRFQRNPPVPEALCKDESVVDFDYEAMRDFGDVDPTTKTWRLDK